MDNLLTIVDRNKHSKTNLYFNKKRNNIDISFTDNHNLGKGSIESYDSLPELGIFLIGTGVFYLSNSHIGKVLVVPIDSNITSISYINVTIQGTTTFVIKKVLANNSQFFIYKTNINQNNILINNGDKCTIFNYLTLTQGVFFIKTLISEVDYSQNLVNSFLLPVYIGYKNGFRYLSYSDKEFKPVIHNRLYKHIIDNVAEYKYVTVDTNGKIISIVQNETMENILGANIDGTSELKFRINPAGLVQYSKQYQDVWFNLEMNDDVLNTTTTNIDGVITTIVGNDTKGTITLQTSNTRLSGNVVVIVFSNVYPTIPFIILSDVNDNYTMGLTGAIKASVTTTTLTLTVKNGLTLEPNTIYKWNYFVKI